MENELQARPSKTSLGGNFSRKITKINHLTLIFNNNPVHQAALQKHLGMFLDLKLKFEEHFKTTLNKIKSFILSRKLLLTIYKSFIRPHLDYGDIVYDQSYNTSLHQRLESLQYTSALATTGAICGTLKEKLNSELDLESLQNGRWYRKLSFYTKLLLTNPLLIFLT